ncbi:hypothetical protein DF3PA_90030 [Candidatus Defluviicoccus seviourii]|uniref:Uncharacterized protein n=1 Tax=Candidatus Defluviicoccus seviourii TaxID=2565273 RepID=A0A564WK09_9PROT|nr:hypothetical protein DF3PA_90030 [Candidatus Defluviicoccus seviourii]
MQDYRADERCQSAFDQTPAERPLRPPYAHALASGGARTGPRVPRWRLCDGERNDA